MKHSATLKYHRIGDYMKPARLKSKLTAFGNVGRLFKVYMLKPLGSVLFDLLMPTVISSLLRTV